jgi:serine/threonine-protein kinase
MNPTAAETYRVLGLTMALQGGWTEAERVLREGMTLQGAGPYTASALGYVLARTGQRAEAERILAELQARAQAGYVSSVAFATLYLGFEQWPEALTWTERACEERRGWVVYLNVNPIVDPLRGRPRFRALVAKVGLEDR